MSFASGNVFEQCLDDWRRYCAEVDKGHLITVSSIKTYHDVNAFLECVAFPILAFLEEGWVNEFSFA